MSFEMTHSFAHIFLFIHWFEAIIERVDCEQVLETSLNLIYDIALSTRPHSTDLEWIR